MPADDSGGDGGSGWGLSLGAGTFNDLGGAISDLGLAESMKTKAEGETTEANNYRLAATLAGENAQFTVESTGIKEVMAQRQIFQGIGTEEASIGANGLRGDTGSSLDLLRDSTSQGALQKGIIGEQGLITEAGYREQQTAYTGLAIAADDAASADSKAGGLADIGAGLKFAAAIATVFV